MTVIRSINARFSAAASGYDSGADVQKEAAAKLVSMMPDLSTSSRILDLGCGSGQLTQRLRARWPHAEIHAVDIAEGMIAEARARTTEDGRLRWIVGNAMTYKDSELFDLVASNCALHWLFPLEAGLRHVASLVARGGTLACSVMLHGTLRELHESRRQASPNKSPLATMPSGELIETLLWQNGLTVVQTSTAERRDSSTSARSVLRTVHNQGFTGGALSRGRLPLTRGEINRLEQIYNEQFRQSDGTVSVTYRVGHFIAEKA